MRDNLVLTGTVVLSGVLAGLLIWILFLLQKQNLRIGSTGHDLLNVSRQCIDLCKDSKITVLAYRDDGASWACECENLKGLVHGPGFKNFVEETKE